MPFRSHSVHYTFSLCSWKPGSRNWVWLHFKRKVYSTVVWLHFKWGIALLQLKAYPLPQGYHRGLAGWAELPGGLKGAGSESWTSSGAYAGRSWWSRLNHTSHLLKRRPNLFCSSSELCSFSQSPPDWGCLWTKSDFPMLFQIHIQKSSKLHEISCLWFATKIGPGTQPRVSPSHRSSRPLKGSGTECCQHSAFSA